MTSLSTGSTIIKLVLLVQSLSKAGRIKAIKDRWELANFIAIYNTFCFASRLNGFHTLFEPILIL